MDPSNISQYVAITKIGYQSPSQRPEHLPDNPDYKYDKDMSSPQFAVYKSLPKRKAILIIRGTADLPDVWTDIKNVISTYGKETSDRFWNAERTVQTLQNTGYTVTMYSHSLGSTIATFISERHPEIRSIEFNRGTSPLELFEQSGARAPPQTTRIGTWTDPLSFFSRDNNYFQQQQWYNPHSLSTYDVSPQPIIPPTELSTPPVPGRVAPAESVIPPVIPIPEKSVPQPRFARVLSVQEPSGQQTSFDIPYQRPRHVLFAQSN